MGDLLTGDFKQSKIESLISRRIPQLRWDSKARLKHIGLWVTEMIDLDEKDENHDKEFRMTIDAIQEELKYIGYNMGAIEELEFITDDEVIEAEK